jgi:hypothetical protein
MFTNGSIILTLWFALIWFRIPVGAEIVTNVPLPKIQDLLPRILTKAETEENNMRLFKERYHYERMKVTEFRNSDGEVIKRVEKKNTSDGPTTGATNEPSGTLKAKRDSPTTNSGTDLEATSKNRPYNKSDFPLTDDLLARFELTIVGEETLNNRPAWVIDFKPISGKKPEKSLIDKFINRTAGRVWVDAQDYAVARADLFLTDRVLVIGGLVGSVWKFTCEMMRERTADGLWFMRNTTWHVEGREFLFRRTVDYHEECDGVRPLPH